MRYRLIKFQIFQYMRGFYLKVLGNYKVVNVLREIYNTCMDYRKHIWLVHSIKIIDIIFIALLFVKKRTVSIRVIILHKRVVAVIIVVSHCRK